MRLNYFIKLIPFFSTFIIIVFLSITNQKEYTKLRILIWNTPSLSLGNYLAISTGTGFILSYFITNSLSNTNRESPKRLIQFKDQEKYENDNQCLEPLINSSYENTLIERNINDPSPTINASFRIIGKNNKDNFIYNNKVQYESNIESENEYDDQPDKDEDVYQNKSTSNNDWSDESYSIW